MSQTPEPVRTAPAELAEWLHQQLNEDARLARAACEYAEAEWRLNDIGDTILCFAPEPRVAENERRLGLPVTADQWRGITIDHASIIPHIARHDPDRVLRAVEAKRQLLSAANVDCPPACSTEHSFSGSCTLRWMGPVWEEGGLRWARDEIGAVVPAPPVVTAWHLRLLAAEYADRPGFREEWRP